MAKTLEINGVTFRMGELRWEDAYGCQMSRLPDFSELRGGKVTAGPVICTVGWAARIGEYWLVVTETGHPNEVYDYTLVPGKAKIILR